MNNSFSWELQFNKPLEISSELDEHSMVMLQSVSLADGASKATLFLTIEGQKFVIASLSARKCTTKLNLILTEEDGQMTLSCSNGSKVIVSGVVESKGCCDHDHGHEDDEISEDAESEMEEEDSIAANLHSLDEKSFADLEEDEDDDDDDEELDDGESMDDEDDDEEEEEEGEEEEEEEEEDDDDEDISEEDSESASDEESLPSSNIQKKTVTFNPKEQGPHKPTSSSQANSLKPAIKQTEQPKAVQPQQPVSRVGQTFSIQGGLKYTVLREGKGPVAAYGKRVNVRYVGCLASNGKRFDKGQIRFKLGGGEVIEGWDKGVKDMRVGESRRLLIPPHLGYGKRGAPPAIPPNAALAFEVELLDLM